MAKKKHILFLSEDTGHFLEEYTRKHPTFTTTSQSADYLLEQARAQALYQAYGEMITPALRTSLRQEIERALSRWFPTGVGVGSPEGSRDG